jgi:hypothetical protein
MADNRPTYGLVTRLIVGPVRVAGPIGAPSAMHRSTPEEPGRILFLEVRLVGGPTTGSFH